MGNFFQVFLGVNWVIFLVGGLILAGLVFLEKKNAFVSKHIKVKPMRFYVTIFIFVVGIAILNYVAMVVFNSWQSMIISVSVVAASGAGLVWFVSRKRKK